MADSNPDHQLATAHNKDAPELSSKHFSPFRLLVIIIVGIFLAEVVAMLVVYILGPLPFAQLTLLDAGIMTALICPLLYFLSFRPLLRYIKKSQQAEDALLCSLEVQERFFDSIDTLIAYMDRDFNFIRVNQAYAMADGKRPEFFIGRNHFELYPHAENREIFQRVVETGEGYFAQQKPFEYPGHPERGITYWNWNLLPVRGVNKDIEGVVFSLVEVTERVRAEEKLRKAYDELELRVQERTEELRIANSELEAEVVERLRTEQAIKESEEKYRSLFNNMSEGFGLHEILLDADNNPCDYRFLELNEAFEELTGISREKALGRTVKELLPNIEPYWIQTYGKVAGTGEPVHYENYSADLGKWYESYCYSPRKNQFAVLFFDITERKQAEEQLRYQAALLSNVNDAILASDAQYRITVWNTAAESVYGWKKEEVVGRNGLEIIQTEWPQQEADEMRRMIAETGRWRGEATQLRKDGTRFTVEVSSMVLFDDAGQVVGYVSVNRDITERKRAEAALHQSRVDLDRAQEVGQIGSWRLDVRRNVLTWSDENYRIFGVPPGTPLTYEAFLEIVHPDDRQLVDSRWKAGMAGAPYDIEHRLLVGGQVKWVREKAFLEFDETGSLLGGFGISQDITERVQAEVALRESEEKYRNLFENMTEEVHFWQLVRDEQARIKTWRLVDANPPSLRTWGKASVEEIKGKTTDEIFGPGATGHYMPVVQKIMSDGMPHSFEDYFPHLDKYFRFTSVPFGDHFITTGADITSIKKAEDALRRAHDELEVRVQERTKELAIANQELLYEIYEREEAERQLRIQTTAMEAAANGIVITDPQGTILWTNPALTRMTGYEKEELIDQTMRLFQSGQHGLNYYKKMWSTILAGKIWRGEMINRRKDGSVYIEEQTITPVRDKDGQISHFIAIKQDITEHKQIEAALELERVRLKNILDTIPDGVYIINQEYDIEYSNPVIEKEFGAVDGRNCYAYFHDLVEPCTWCKNEEVFTGMPLTGEQTYRNNKSYEIFDAPLVNADGSVSKLKLLHDITQRKKMELDLEQSNQDLQSASNAERKQRQLAEALVAAALVLNKSLELDEVLKIILEQISKAIPYQFADIGLLEGEAFYEASHQGEADLPATRVGIMKRYLLADFPLLDKMCQSGQPVLIPATEREPAWMSIESFEWCRSFLSAPLIVEKQVIGFVNLFAAEADFFTQEMCDRLVAFAAHAAAAIQNAWLFEQVRASSERLQSLSRRLVEIQENERLYIARELHDEAGQMLTSLLVDLRLLEKNTSEPEVMLKIVGEMEGSLNAVIENLHRMAMALRPASLDHVGLVAALRQYVESVGEKQGLKISFNARSFQERLPANVETVLYRIVQESITNVVRHARASQVDVILTVRNKKLIVIIEDDGIGFDPGAVSTGEHLGIFGMRERAEMINGNLLIESAPGKGTTIMVEVDYVDTNIGR